LDSWRKSFDADIIGLLTLINASLPHLEAAAAATKNASIVVISSLAGFERRLPEVVSPYTAFKRAQAIIARDYVRKVGPMGIRINIIIPGAIETPSITKPDGTTELSTFQESMKDHEEAFRQFFASMPLRRTGKPAEISNAAIFLASPLASYITGAELLIDGGLSMFL
jgi:NAD(P)-dependent dehydrogenase (short-subunit alcohol dehydrogenase family)